MDILKRIYKNTSICKIDGNVIHVSKKDYPSSMPVEFPSEKSKNYTLGEVVFYLLNSELSFTEYVEKCQIAGILPVNYLDQIAIKEDIDSYQIQTVPGVFIEPCYTHNLKYKIPRIDENVSMVLVNDLTSRVTINNVTRLLCENRFEPEEVIGQRKGGTVHFEYDGRKYSISENMPVNSWEEVSVVFFDVGMAQADEWLRTHEKIPQNAVIFSFQGDSLGVFHVILSERRIQNYEAVWEKIKG